MIFGKRKDTRVADTGPVYLTAKGADDLKRKLARLNEMLPKLIAETQRTAAFGDRSDSAEYSEAKSALRRTNFQIASIEDKLRRLEIIKPNAGGGIIEIGSTVSVLTEAGAEKTFTIVGPMETEPTAGYISNKSPLGVALLGRIAGDKVSVDTPAGQKIYTIIKVK